MQDATLVAGDTLNFEPVVCEFPSTDGWTLRYRLVPAPGNLTGAPITFAATGQTDGSYLVQVGPSVTSAWVPGAYSWASWVEQTGQRFQVDAGLVGILPDPAQMATGVDTRTQAAKAVDDLKAALATYTSSNGTVQRYTIGSRQMEFRAAADIIVLLNYWQAELAKEQRAEAAANGHGNPRRFFVRFGAPQCWPWHDNPQ